jgi:hypothetical protein
MEDANTGTPQAPTRPAAAAAAALPVPESTQQIKCEGCESMHAVVSCDVCHCTLCAGCDKAIHGWGPLQAHVRLPLAHGHKSSFANGEMKKLPLSKAASAVQGEQQQRDRKQEAFASTVPFAGGPRAAGPKQAEASALSSCCKVGEGNAALDAFGEQEGEEEDDDEPTMCAVHPAQRVTAYCYQHERLVCNACLNLQDGTCADHPSQVGTLVEAAAKARVQLEQQAAEFLRVELSFRQEMAMLEALGADIDAAKARLDARLAAAAAARQQQAQQAQQDDKGK